MFRLIFLLLIPYLLLAKTYEKIEFVGLSYLNDFAAKEIIGFDASDDISKEMIARSIKDLFKQGYFLDIIVQTKNNKLIYDFTQKPLIKNIFFSGVNENDQKEKYAPLLGFKRGDIFDEGKLEKAKEAIKSQITTTGFYSSLVESNVQKVSGGVDVYIDINKGKRIIITQSIFDGLESFDRTQIEANLANRQRQSFGWFFGRNDGKLNLVHLDLDDERIADFYMRKGFLDVNVQKPLLEVDFNNFSARLYYKLTEGEPYFVSDIDLEFVDGEIELDEDTKDGFKQFVNRRFDISRVRHDMNLIKEDIGSKGYAFVRVIPDMVKDKETLRVKLIYRILKGKKVYINDVIIAGNTRTLDRVIRREVFLAPGDLYNLKEITESKKALGRLGFFEKIDFTQERISQDKINIIVEVKETNTGKLEAGGGWNSYNGFSFKVSAKDRNVLGSSISLGVNFEKSEKTKSLSFSVYNPRLNDSSYSSSTSFYVNETEETDYKTSAKGISQSFGKRLSRYLYSSVGLIADKSSNTYFNLSASQKLFYYQGDIVKLSIVPHISYNDTDDYFVPRSGKNFWASIEHAGFGGDQEFTKLTSSFSYFYSLERLIDYDIILRYKLRFAALNGDLDNSRSLPLSSRLYLGGVGSVRGFRRNSISPMDLSYYESSKNKDDIIRIGGDLRASNSFEVSFPLMPTAKMRLLGFFDMGGIGRGSLDETRSSYGTGIEWYSPMGAILFLWAWPTSEKEFDDTSNFEFSIGQVF